MAEHRLCCTRKVICRQAIMQRRRVAGVIYLKKMRRAGQTLICGRLTALPMILTRKPHAERECIGFARRTGSGHRDPSVIDYAISCVRINP